MAQIRAVAAAGQRAADEKAHLYMDTLFVCVGSAGVSLTGTVTHPHHTHTHTQMCGHAHTHSVRCMHAQMFTRVNTHTHTNVWAQTHVLYTKAHTNTHAHTLTPLSLQAAILSDETETLQSFICVSPRHIARVHRLTLRSTVGPTSSLHLDKVTSALSVTGVSREVKATC